MNKTLDLSEIIDFNNLIYYFKGKNGPKTFIGYEGPLNFYRIVKDGYTTLEKPEESQKKSKSDINEIIKGQKKSEEQKSATKNIKTLDASREKVIKLFNDYSKIVSEAKYKTIYGEEIEI